MKLKYIFVSLSLVLFMASCTDDAIIENHGSSQDFNIAEFSEGFSLAFDVSLDNMGGGMSTRADELEAQITEWENYLDPEEIRVIFFDKEDRYLFESKTRWLTSIASHGGGGRWRVGVPVFQYVADSYDDTDPENSGKPVEDGEYNWNRIVEIMRKEPFKVAILANRPSKVEVPELSDWKEEKNNDDKLNKIAAMGSALNGPFWTPENSIATENVNVEDVAKVIDLHHCQFDPLYYYKSERGGQKNVTPPGDGWYDFIMDYGDYEDLNDVPFMGAATSWVSANRSRVVTDLHNDNKSSPRTIRYYRLPVDRRGEGHPGNGIIEDRGDGYKIQDSENEVATNDKYVENNSDRLDVNQYIPMYGIQQYDALTTWEKGKTYNLSEQTGSQTGDYQYKSIKLLRSVVKLELRIPMYDHNGNYVDIDNAWAQLWLSNYMSRCEPMDVSTPTNEIWSDDHNNCEWTNIRDYGLLADNDANQDFKKKLAWFYGSWENLGWIFKEGKNKDGNTIDIPPSNTYPKIFNPLTQRLQGTLITDCYLPIGEKVNGTPDHPEQYFHRWVVYCGERNMTDQTYLGDATSTGTLIYFRIHVRKKDSYNNIIEGTDCILNLPIIDYSQTDYTIDVPDKDGQIQQIPAKKYFKETNYTAGSSGKDSQNIYFMDGISTNFRKYIEDMMTRPLTDSKYYPYPLLRNHYYRITVSFDNSEDGIDIKVINGEKRTVGGIEFY